MEQITLSAPDITCEHCKHSIEHGLAELSGVQSVSVDIPNKQVNVTYDVAQVSREVIVAKLDDEGYPVAS